MATAYKWLPVVNEDSCSGCSKCVEACDHQCLELVWSYAKLQRPVDCGSEGTCMDACPEDAIRMEWIASAGNHNMGEWQFLEPPPEPPAANSWIQRILRGRQTSGRLGADSGSA